MAEREDIMSKLTYTVEGNQICLSNGTEEKNLEWIHEGLLRVFKQKNSEEQLHFKNHLMYNHLSQKHIPVL